MQQLFAAARLPDSGISEIAVNASLAFIEGAKPAASSVRLVQMACTHSAAMAVHLTGFGEPSVAIEVSLRWRPRQLDSSMCM